MSTIKGKNVWLYWTDADDVLKPLACFRSCSLTTTAELFETSTLGTGKWQTFKGNRVSWGVSCDGLQSFDTNMTVSSLRVIQLNMEPVFISFTATDENSITETYNGYVLVTSIESSSSHNAPYTYSVTAQGSGELILTDIPVDPNFLIHGLMIYKYDGTGSETDGNTLPPIAELAGVEVLGIERDGLYHRKVASAPADMQFMLDSGDPTVIIFAADLPAIEAGEMIDIFYQNI